MGNWKRRSELWLINRKMRRYRAKDSHDIRSYFHIIGAKGKHFITIHLTFYPHVHIMRLNRIPSRQKESPSCRSSHRELLLVVDQRKVWEKVLFH